MQSNWTGSPTTSPRHLQPMQLTQDPALMLILERQSHFNQRLDRIEYRIDQIPDCKAPELMAEQTVNRNDSGQGFTIAGAWFQDWRALAAWLILAALIGGHVTLSDLSKALMQW